MPVMLSPLSTSAATIDSHPLTLTQMNLTMGKKHLKESIKLLLKSMPGREISGFLMLILICYDGNLVLYMVGYRGAN